MSAFFPAKSTKVSQLAEALKTAALPYMVLREATELANNVAMTRPGTLLLEARFAKAIKSRIGNGWAHCSDVTSCAENMARVFRRWHRLQGVAVSEAQ